MRVVGAFSLPVPVEVGDPVRVTARNIVEPEIRITELLKYYTVSAKPARRGGHGGVEKAERAKVVESCRQLEVFEEWPGRKAPDGFKGRTGDKESAIAKAKTDPGPAGTPAVESKERALIIELEAERAGDRRRLCQRSPDVRESVGWKMGIGV